MKLLFVCTGNICRSPTAEGVLRHRAQMLGTDILADSCGTHSYHTGEAPDRRAIEVAKNRGYDLSALRARRLKPADFTNFDMLLAMDRGHHQVMVARAPSQYADRVRLFLEFAPECGADVPDPYYGSAADFETALDLIETGVAGLLDHLTANGGTRNNGD